MTPTDSTHPPLGEELIPPGEDVAIQAVVDACLEMMETTQSPVPRQQHPKGHGCVRATFTVAADVHADLRHGILANPHAYQVIMRFSNGAHMDDRSKGVHGLAIKLFGVFGPKVLDEARDATTQDFVFMDHGTFFIRNAHDYAEMSRSMREGTRRQRSRWAALIPEVIRSKIMKIHLVRTYLLSHKAEKNMVQAARSAPPVSPLESRYFSVTPAKLGPNAVRWSLDPRPLAAPIPAVTDGDERDRLRLAMQKHLAIRDAAFDVFVQRQTDPASMPVEDPTVAWDELVSPRYRVGTIEIPKQQFDTPHKRTVGDALAFTNWHCLPEHRPLGGINRVRRAVYHTVATHRRKLNGHNPVEPGDDWLDTVWDASSPATHA